MAEDALELPGRVPVRLGEDLLDALVDFLHHLKEIAPRLLQVLELLAEELVALLQRGELLESQRIHLPELLVRPFG